MTQKLDQFDVKILSALQENGRLTKLKLAEVVGLSPTPCFNRLRRLETLGFIRAYEAEVALERICRNVIVFVAVTLKNHRSEDFVRFERSLLAVPEVLEVWSIGGAFDYLLKVVAADLTHYQALIEEMLDASIGISTYFSYIAIKRVKRARGFPLKALLAAQGELADLR